MGKTGPDATARIAARALSRQASRRVVHGAVLNLPETALWHTAAGSEADLQSRKSPVHRIALMMVWLTIFSGFFVVFEPAPFDAFLIGLILLLDRKSVV